MNKSYWKAKTSGLVFRLLIAGGLIVLLLYFFQNTRAVVLYENGEYKLKTEKYTGDRAEVIQDIIFTDFNEDGEREKIVLKDGVVTVKSNSGEILKTDSGWKAEQILTGDFNNDGVKDLGIYLWKVGNYGPSRPFWVEENDDSYKQHLFLYTWRDDGLKALWHSSNLPYENIETILADVNNDGENELVVLEKPYNLDTDYGVTAAVWKWDEWGFFNIWRSSEGKFKDLETE